MAKRPCRLYLEAERSANAPAGVTIRNSFAKSTKTVQRFMAISDIFCEYYQDRQARRAKKKVRREGKREKKAVTQQFRNASAEPK